MKSDREKHEVLMIVAEKGVQEGPHIPEQYSAYMALQSLDLDIIELMLRDAKCQSFVEAAADTLIAANFYQEFD